MSFHLYLRDMPPKGHKRKKSESWKVQSKKSKKDTKEKDKVPDTLVSADASLPNPESSDGAASSLAGSVSSSAKEIASVKSSKRGKSKKDKKDPPAKARADDTEEDEVPAPPPVDDMAAEGVGMSVESLVGAALVALAAVANGVGVGATPQVDPESSVAASIQEVPNTLGASLTSDGSALSGPLASDGVALAGPLASDGVASSSGKEIASASSKSSKSSKKSKRNPVHKLIVDTSPATGAVMGAVAALDDDVRSLSGSALGVEWGGLNPMTSESTSPLLGPSTSIIPVSPMKTVDNDKIKERPKVGGKSTTGWKQPPVAEPIPVSPIKTVDNGKGKERPKVGGKSTSGWKQTTSGWQKTPVVKPSSAATHESSSDQDSDASEAEEETGSSMKKTGSSKKARSEKETTSSIQMPSSSKETASSIEMPSSSKETASSSSVTQKPTSSTKTSYEVKRHKGKKLKDPLQGICKNEIKRLARRAGVSRIGGGVYEELRLQTQSFLDDLLFKAFVHTEHRQAQTVTPMDVVNGFKTMGGSYLGA